MLLTNYIKWNKMEMLTDIHFWVGIFVVIGIVTIICGVGKGIAKIMDLFDK